MVDVKVVVVEAFSMVTVAWVTLVREKKVVGVVMTLTFS